MQKRDSKLITILVVIGYLAILLSITSNIFLIQEETRQKAIDSGFQVPEKWALGVSIILGLLAATALYQIKQYNRQGLYALTFLAIIASIFGLITNQINLLGILLKLTYVALFYLEDRLFN